MADKLKVTLVKSPIGCVPKHRRTVEALGLKKVNKTVELFSTTTTMTNSDSTLVVSSVDSSFNNKKRL